jgi:hypothetical protein
MGLVKRSHVCRRLNGKHFCHERHLNRREIFKENRTIALSEWRQLAA